MRKLRHSVYVSRGGDQESSEPPNQVAKNRASIFSLGSLFCLHWWVGVAARAGQVGKVECDKSSACGARKLPALALSHGACMHVVVEL